MKIGIKQDFVTYVTMNIKLLHSLSRWLHIRLLTHLPIVLIFASVTRVRLSIGSNNGLSPIRHQAIIKTNAGLLSIGPLGTNFSEILIKIRSFSFKKMSSTKWRPFCPGGDGLKLCCKKSWDIKGPEQPHIIMRHKLSSSVLGAISLLNSLCPSDTIWRHRTV